MKKCVLLCIGCLLTFSLVACSGGGGSGASETDSNNNTADTTSSITGRAVKGPIENAQIRLFYFDNDGNEIEILAADGDVFTDVNGAFSFDIEGRELMGISSPLLIRTYGGTMYGESAPTLEAVIADPMPLTFARVSLTCHLSVPSSVAAGLFKRLAASTGAPPGLKDAQQVMARVANQLYVDLTADPAEPGNTLGMFNQSMDRVLDLPDTPLNNPAVDEFISYLVANLSSTSGALDSHMDDPASPGSDIEAAFTPGSVLAGVVGTPSDFLLMRLESDLEFFENDGKDAAFITATLMDAEGQPSDFIDDIDLGLYAGAGRMTLQWYDYGQGQVQADLSSDTAGNNVVRAEYILANGNTIIEEITVRAVDLVADADGDGFSDGEEHMGWEILVDTLGYGSDGNGQLLTRRLVTSDPALADTDSDGVNDYDEFLAGTDPRMMDTDGDGLTDGEEMYRWISSPIGVDTDGDARGPNHDLVPTGDLFDGNELFLLSTSPTLDDTDGDGRTDHEEYDHPSRSPLVADLPKLELEIVDAVDVRLDVTYAEESGTSFEYGSELMKSTTTSTSRYNESSINLGVEVGYEFSVGFFPKGSVSTKLSFDYGKKWSTTRTSSNTAQQSHSQYTTDSRTRTETAATGSMSAGIRLRNPGNISYALSNLGITVRHWEMGWDVEQQKMVKSFQTVATLVPSLGSGITLAPGEETPVLQVAAAELNPERVKELLRRPDSLYLEAAYFEMENAENVNFDFLKEVNASRTASVIIDSGQSDAEEYRVATNVQRGEGGTFPGITLGEILSDVLHIEYSTIARKKVDPSSLTNEQVLYSLRGVSTELPQADPAKNYWIVVHESEHPSSGIYNFDEVAVRAGDRVLLIYVRDDDADGLNALEEQHYGTYTAGLDDADHDGDGLSDYEEVRIGWPVTWTDAGSASHSYQVWSDPTSTDQDGDGLLDSNEKNQGTNPSLPDTDRDGILDGDDPWPLYQARVLYVDQKATGNKDGSSWEDAFTDLQDALGSAWYAREVTPDEPSDDVAEIWVADGIYLPDSSNEEPQTTASFLLVEHVALFGGFRGIESDFNGETKRSQREKNPRVNGTILSGKLLSGANSRTVVRAREYTRLDGFQITGGDSSAESIQNAGGLYILNGPVTLQNLFFVDNKGIRGGALYIFDSGDSPTGGVKIFDCVFSENQVPTYPAGAGAGGGAVYIWSGSTVLIDGCRFVGNVTIEGGHGGALYSRAANLTIKNTDFLYNDSTTLNSTGPSNGGAINTYDCGNLVVDHCRFIGNRTNQWGGGIAVNGYGGVAPSKVVITNSLFWKNVAGEEGTEVLNTSGAGIYGYANAKLSITNCTVVENTSYSNSSVGGGIAIEEMRFQDSLIVQNSILWGNRAGCINDPWFGDANVVWAQVGLRQRETTWNDRVFYASCLQGLQPVRFYGRYGLDCIWQDPKFKSAGGTLELDTGSPCIDAGNTYVDADLLTTGFQPLPETDLAGAPRIIDGDLDGFFDVDMGAYEYQGN